MAITSKDIMSANSKSPPDVYAVTAMLLAIGALKAKATEGDLTGTIIRQLEVAIDKLSNKDN